MIFLSFSPQNPRLSLHPIISMDTCLSCQKGVNQNDLSRTYQRSMYINNRRVPKDSRLKCTTPFFRLCADCQNCATCHNKFSTIRKVARQCATAFGLTCDRCVETVRVQALRVQKHKAKRKAEEIDSSTQPEMPPRFRTKYKDGKTIVVHDPHYTKEEALGHLEALKNIREYGMKVPPLNSSQIRYRRKVGASSTSSQSSTTEPNATTNTTPSQTSTTTTTIDTPTDHQCQTSTTTSATGTPIDHRCRLLNRLGHHYPMELAQAISGSLTKYCTTDANCGTCIPFPTLRAVRSSLRHHQTFIDQMKLLNKQPKLVSLG